MVGFRYQGRARTIIASNPFALLRNAVGVFRRGFGVVDTLGMLECWNGSGLLTLEEVRFANRSTLSLEVLPTQALGRTGALLPWGLIVCWIGFRRREDLDFWRWVIREAFRLGLVGRLRLPGLDADDRRVQRLARFGNAVWVSGWGLTRSGRGVARRRVARLARVSIVEDVLPWVALFGPAGDLGGGGYGWRFHLRGVREAGVLRRFHLLLLVRFDGLYQSIHDRVDPGRELAPAGTDGDRGD